MSEGFDFARLYAAVRAVLGGFYAERLRGAYAVIQGAPAESGRVNSYADIGTLLVPAFSTDEALSGFNLSPPLLHGATVLVDDEQEALTPADASRHPLVGRWAAPDASRALAYQIAIAGRPARTADPFPAMWNWTFGGDDAGARAALTIFYLEPEPCQIAIHYGAPFPAGPIEAVRLLQGSAVLALSAHLHDSTEPASEGSPTCAARAALATAEAASAVIH